jgi:hypothetical protein
VTNLLGNGGAIAWLHVHMNRMGLEPLVSQTIPTMEKYAHMNRQNTTDFDHRPLQKGVPITE